MLLGGDIVLETLQNYVELKKHLAKAKDFILQNPWSITVPEGISIEEVATIRTDFFVDSYSKIYIQLKKKDPNLTSKSPQLIYYYK